LLLVLAGMILFAGVAPALAVSFDQEELLFLRHLNEHRRVNGLAPLALSDQLSLTAERHSSDMGVYGFFSHTTQRSDWYPAGSEFWQRLARDGYGNAGGTGENLAAGMALADQAFQSWKGSPGHNENMLDPGSVRWKEVGIARVQVSGSPFTWYWATEFGTDLDPTAHDPFAGGGAGPFPDVNANHPFSAAIGDLSREGTISGFTNGTFGPGSPVIRQQFAKMIVGALALPVSENDISPFPDVPVSGPTDLYPDNFVAVAAARGLTKGTGPNTFAPAAQISRAQVVSMVVRAASGARTPLYTPPADYRSSWGNFSQAHQENARLAQFNGLLSNLPVAALDPWAPMPRGEVAQVLVNMQDRIAR
jgi:hypothetical protein